MRPDSGRNNALNIVSFRMATMAARGWIDKELVRERLRQPCVENGLTLDGPREVEGTFESGWIAGLKCPHPDLEDRNNRPNKAAGRNGHVAHAAANGATACDDEEPLRSFAAYLPLKIIPWMRLAATWRRLYALSKLPLRPRWIFAPTRRSPSPL